MGSPKKEELLIVELLTRFKNKRKKESSRSKIGRKQKKKVPDQGLEENKRKKFPTKDRKKIKEKESSRSDIGRKQKKRKSPIKDRKKMKEFYRKVFGPDEYPSNTKLSQPNKEKKGNHDLKWFSPFDCQPKSCALATFSSRTKQKHKRKRTKHSEPNFPPKTLFPKKSY